MVNVGRAFGCRAPVQLAVAGLLFALTYGAHAQEKRPDTAADDHIQEVVIPGSRIARPDLDRLQPTTVAISLVVSRSHSASVSTS